MTTIIPIICVLGAVSALVPIVRADDSLTELSVQAATILGWLGVLSGAAGIYLGEVGGTSSLMAIAGCAALAVLPAHHPSAATRRFASPGVGAFAAGLGVAALVGPTTAVAENGLSGQSELLLLYAAVAGGLSACISSLISSTALADLAITPDDRPTPAVGAASMIIVSLLAFWILGSSRAVDGLASWAAPLAVDGESLSWYIPDGANLPRGLFIQVASPVSYVAPALVFAALAAATGAWLNLTVRSRKLAAAAWATPGIIVAVVGAMLIPGQVDVSRPDADVYTEIATSWLAERGLPETLVEAGGYVADGAVSIDIASMLPDFILLGIALLLSVSAAVVSLRPPPPAPEDERDAIAVGMLSRDLTIRAMIVGWLAWLMTVLVHWVHFGYYGVGSPAELVLVGSLVLMSGLALLGWSLPRRRPWGRLRALTSGLMLIVLVLAIVSSLVFNTPVGLSLSL